MQQTFFYFFTFLFTCTCLLFMLSPIFVGLLSNQNTFHQRQWACVCFGRRDRREKGEHQRKLKQRKKMSGNKSDPSHILVNQSTWIWKSQMTPKFTAANVSQIARLQRTWINMILFIGIRFSQLQCRFTFICRASLWIKHTCFQYAIDI